MSAPRESDMESTKVELLPLFQSRVHIVHGKWEFDGAALALVGAEPHSRVVLPYIPPEEYDFRVEFTPENTNPVDVMLVHNRVDFFFEIAPGFAAFAMAQGKPPSDPDNPSMLKSANFYLSGDNKTMSLMLQVRSYRVTALLNGQKIIDWETDYFDLGMDPNWGLPLPILGVGGFCAMVKFHALTVTEITGKGLVLPPEAFHRQRR